MLQQNKAQFTTEYIVVIGIALSIIAVFLAYVFVYYSAYSNNSNVNQISTITSSIVDEANFVSMEGNGSKTSFTLGFPNLQTGTSFFCGDYVKVTSSQYSNIGQANVDLEGVLPIKQGSYIMYARYDQPGIVQIGFDSAFPYINYSYSYNSSRSILTYNLTFFDSEYNVINYSETPVPYNITVLSTTGSYINGTSSPESTSGTLHLKTPPPKVIIDVFVNDTVAPSCFNIS